MSNSIRLSPKYGVNPTIAVCAFCGCEKNQIAFLGKLGGRGEDIEAPMKAVLDYIPCEKCQEKWNEGVALIEVTFTPTVQGQPPIQENPHPVFPTGNVAVVRPEALVGDFKWGSRALVPSEDFRQMFGE